MPKQPKKTEGEKPWSGRFKEATHPLVEAFTQSLDVDARLADADIRQSRAHAEMLAAAGIISRSESRAISIGLDRIAKELASGTFPFDTALEDIHMNIERRLAALIGPAAGKLHTARSRNDQVTTDLKLYLKDASAGIIERIRGLQRAFIESAEAHEAVIIPGYTHLQQAQPVPASHHLMAYFYMLERDAGRFRDALTRADTCPLGAGALAGTSLPIDRQFTARKLGFDRPAENSMDAVSDRDFAVEAVAAAALCAVHLSRFAEEITLWMSQEFALITLPDSLCTGSSIMPHKKNPDVAELTRGKSARVIGDLVMLLTLLKGLPLTYNRDLQEDKRPLFDALDTLAACLETMTAVTLGLQFNAPRAETLVSEGRFLTSVDLTDYLVGKGMPFRETHHVVGSLVRWCEDNNRGLAEVSLEDLRRFSHLFDADAMECLSAAESVEHKKSAGAASPAEVKKQIAAAKKLIGE